jgi:hypothetical protein
LVKNQPPPAKIAIRNAEYERTGASPGQMAMSRKRAHGDRLEAQSAFDGERDERKR